MPRQRDTRQRTRHFNRKFLMLTYSQTCAQFNPNIIIDLVHKRGGTCAIAKEQHKDGGDHYHVFCDFSRHQLQTRNLTIFDVPLGNNKSHHPNWLAVTQTPWHTYDYTIKDANVIFNDCKRPEERRNSTNETWTKLMTAASEEEFMAGMETWQPRALVTCFSNIRKFVETKYKPAKGSQYDGPQIELLDCMPANLRDWINGFNAGCQMAQELNKPNERYDSETQQPFIDIPDDEDLNLSFSMDQVDLERQSSPDHLENIPTSVAHSTSMTMTTTANTQCSTTWNADWDQWLDGKAGWEDSTNSSSPTNTRKNEPSSGGDVLFTFPTQTHCWNEEWTETGLWQTQPW